MRVSSDVDGTDASAKGTLAEDDLSPELPRAGIEALGREVELVAADVMEAPPDLARSDEGRTTTVARAACYALACLRSRCR